MFWSKILTGLFWSVDFGAWGSGEFWGLGQYVMSGASIFEYPWQILVLGLLMGILSITAVLISQLMSFRYSVPFILAVVFLGNLPGLGICLVVSCVAVACRPLRFRSRVTSIALCTAPQLVYWGYFGGVRELEPLKFGFSFTPWICAWLVGLGIAAGVLGIGHFTRYKPGLVWIVTALVLAGAFVVFEVNVGFDELDYQLYVAKNNPEQVSKFYDQSITESLDNTIKNKKMEKYFTSFFYPAEPILLRAELKSEIQNRLSYDRWPSWFLVSEELKYQEQRHRLNVQYDLFINTRDKSPRMPIALYYKGLLSEYSPDINLFGQEEVLHFYSDYPFERSREIWYRLYSEFGDSPESLEARWRIAKRWSGQGRFERADALLEEAQAKVVEELKLLEEEQPQPETLFSPFRPPAKTVMTQFKLAELYRKLNQLRSLIGEENKGDKEVSAERLAKFVMLNPHASSYGRELDELAGQMERTDRLYDNVLLEKTKLIADEQLRAESLSGLHKDFKDTDGGMHALYELGLLKISQWRQQDDSSPEQKKKYLADARATLESFTKLYPDSFCAEQVKKNLNDLPAN